MAKAKLTQRQINWSAHMKRMGHEIRVTKNGHPFAVVRSAPRPAKKR